MIEIREKDILFLALNVVFFISGIVWIFFVTIADIAIPYVDTSDPEIGSVLSLLSAEAHTLYLIGGVIVIMFDLWWLFRLVKAYHREYRRENL